MENVRIMAVREPLTAPTMARRAVATIGRADAMGLLPEDEVVDTLDLTTVKRVARHVSRAGLAPGVSAELAAWSEAGAKAARLGALLDELYRALAESPIPTHEWPRLLARLQEQLLARLLSVSVSSLRRYASGTRRTPDDVAARLHHLALLVGNLAGTYNDIGIRRWFDRRRAQLDGRAPAQLLRKGWCPEDAGPARVLALSAALMDSPAT